MLTAERMEELELELEALTESHVLVSKRCDELEAKVAALERAVEIMGNRTPGS